MLSKFCVLMTLFWVVFGKTLDVILKAATELFALYSIWFSDNGLAINATESNYLVFGVK